MLHDGPDKIKQVEKLVGIVNNYFTQKKLLIAQYETSGKGVYFINKTICAQMADLLQDYLIRVEKLKAARLTSKTNVVQPGAPLHSSNPTTPIDDKIKSSSTEYKRLCADPIFMRDFGDNLHSIEGSYLGILPQSFSLLEEYRNAVEYSVEGTQHT
jgi:hypothetical protein